MKDIVNFYGKGKIKLKRNWEKLLDDCKGSYMFWGKFFISFD